MLYKYFVMDEADQEQERCFDAQNDAEAIKYALDDSDVTTDENGQPIIYKEHEQTSHYGCGHENCISCGGWHLIGRGESVHGVAI